MSTTLPAPAGPTLMTADEFWDYCQLQENAGRTLEVIRGVVVDVTPLPVSRELVRAVRVRGVVCANIGFSLGEYCRRTGIGYVACNNSGVVLHQHPVTVIGPDVALYPRMTRVSDGGHGWATTPPVAVADVASPTDRPGAMAARIREYVRAGVPLTWLVEPADETVTVFSPTRAPVTLTAADTLEDGADLPGFACRVADLFRFAGGKSAVMPRDPSYSPESETRPPCP